MNKYKAISKELRYQEHKKYFNLEYSSKTEPIWSLNRPSRATSKLISHAIDKLNNPNILDIGFGMGDYLYYSADKTNGKIVGIENIDLPLRLAMDKYKLNIYKNISLIKADFWTFESQLKYDIIIDSGFFHHIKIAHRDEYIKKIQDYGKKIFYLIITVYGLNNCLYRKSNNINKWIIHKGCYDYYFGYNDIHNIFKDYRVVKFIVTDKNRPRELLNYLLEFKV